LANSVWGANIYFGRADALQANACYVHKTFMVINDSDCQRVYA